MADRSRASTIIVLIVALVGVGALGLKSRDLPDISARSVTTHFTDTGDTRIGRAIASAEGRHPNLTGVVALANGRDAFAARALLAEAAERSIDIQYYIWEHDVSGTLLYEALHRAADRGVRVRLLLDDNRTVGHDALLAALDDHPNIEVRLFNPFKFRDWRVIDYVFDFARINRRMHNKSFTVDNQATIIGGRNVGDEYFGANQQAVMYDLDVLAVGAVVEAVSKDFDGYWASPSAYPASVLLHPTQQPSLDALTVSSLQLKHEAAAQAYMEALQRQPFVEAMLEQRLQFDWTKTHLVSDSPSKALNEATEDEHLWTQVKALLGAPESDMQLISPYVVPQEQGALFLSSIAATGASVQLLTNSLEATDVAAVHAGYVKWREPLLESGVRIFELRRESYTPTTTTGGSWGSAASTLHAKSFAVDGTKIFIGSFNFDPRSARLNTEMGFVVESDALASRMRHLFAQSIPDRSYEVRLRADGEGLEWVERRNGEEIVHDTEPGTTYVRRMMVSFLSLLPIDWML